MIRFLLTFVAGCCLFTVRIASADDAVPFVMPKQYSADMTFMMNGRETVKSRFFTDNGKIRTEMNKQGKQLVSIIRPDQQKIYVYNNVMVTRKIIGVMPLDWSKIPPEWSPGSTMNGQFDLIGPDTVDSVACTKYKMATKDGKVGFIWVDAAKKVLVKMTPEDGSSTVLWKNVQLGPQGAALFEPPADYKQMQMPATPAAPAQ